MSHHAGSQFWKAYASLPSAIQKLADECFELLKSDPRHPSLHLKHVDRYWSVRVGRRHRAVGVTCENGIAWFWIGTHAEYERVIRS